MTLVETLLAAAGRTTGMVALTAALVGVQFSLVRPKAMAAPAGPAPYAEVDASGAKVAAYEVAEVTEPIDAGHTAWILTSTALVR